ncbi:hypothetical protein [Nocardiopsis sp. YSL2]|uniref:hypothetical protein n=1 Tax=Nocardiopsis sp. YSL2 TaxID=2939492 RepID=UPI0026F436B1|nr:hypothetical protein [Nocardiopsis sp. YSL2]
MLIDIDRLRSPLGHEFLPIEGHEDDNCCAQVTNGATQCGEPDDAHHAPEAVSEYLDLMAERLEDPVHDVGHDIGTWFSLSYSNFLVLHRVLLEHMPRWWQLAFVNRLEQLHAAYSHLEHPPSFEVHPCKFVIVEDLDDDQRKKLGVTSSMDDFPDMPEDPTEEQFDAHEAAYDKACDAEVFYDADGNELDRNQRVPLRVPDPIPHYRYGHVEPRLP